MPVIARLTVGALEKLPAKVKIAGAGSVCGSVISVASNKSANGMIKRHCGPCKKKVHEGVEVESVKCTGD